jgi:hypothetical protein
VIFSRLRGQPPRPRLTRIYSITCAVLIFAAVGIGLVIYPVYKVRVVGGYFLDHAPWAAALFDIKEAMGLFGLPLGAGLWVLGRRPDPDSSNLVIFALCAFGLFAVAAFCAVSGLVIVAEKSF